MESEIRVFKQEKEKIEETIERKEQISIADPEEAREFVKNQIEKGELPVVTIPKKFVEYLKNGLKAHTNWTGHKILAATLGRDYYLPEGEDRIAIKIKNFTVEQILPRFTGPDKSYHGIVVIDGPVSYEQLEIIS